MSEPESIDITSMQEASAGWRNIHSIEAIREDSRKEGELFKRAVACMKACDEIPTKELDEMPYKALRGRRNFYMQAQQNQYNVIKDLQNQNKLLQEEIDSLKEIKE